MNRSTSTILATVIGATLLAGCGTTAGGSASSGASATSTAGTAQGTSMLLPVSANPIVNQATAPTLAVTQALAENNVDPTTGLPMGDRLQLTLHNSGSAPLGGFEVYYTMTDAVTKASEHYYQRLRGLSIPGGATRTVYFDNKAGLGHYPENQFSIYRSSRNRVDFAIEVSAKGAKVATATAVKSTGTAEKVD